MNGRDIVNKKNLPVVGTVCGDILGSKYEWGSTKNYDHELCRTVDVFTDDTVCTMAVADAILSGKPFSDTIAGWCRRYPGAGYGGGFRRWMNSDSRMPYNSFGNGSAMRVSPAAVLAGSLEEALELAERSAEVTHNHPEGIKGAQAVAAAIYAASSGMDKDGIRSLITERFGYDLDRRYDDIQPDYTFQVSCMDSVPESIICFLESSDYEDAVRRAIAMGGDADTMSAIVGGIAAAYYGEIPERILDHCLARLPEEMKDILCRIS